MGTVGGSTSIVVLGTIGGSTSIVVHKQHTPKETGSHGLAMAGLEPINEVQATLGLTEIHLPLSPSAEMKRRASP